MMEGSVNNSTWDGFETMVVPDVESHDASVFLGVLLVLLSAISILGNIATIWAFKTNQKLRHNQSNLLILGLSCFDLVIGATGLPAAAIYTGFGTWPLGRDVCVINALFSVVGVSGAMYTVTAINIDRYLLVSRDYSAYLRIQSSRNLKLQIAGFWLLAWLISLSETIIWTAGGVAEVEKLIDYTKECRSPVRTDPQFAIATSVILFAIPFCIMIVSNLRFVVLFRRRLRRRYTSSMTSSNAASKKEDPPGTKTSGQKENDNQANPEELQAMTSNKPPEDEDEPHPNEDGPHPNEDGPRPTEDGPHPDASSPAPLISKPNANQSHHPDLRKKSSSAKMKNRYIKPAVRLAILMSVFGFCSLPYPIFVLIADTKCSDCAVVVARNHLSNLLLANSALNPFVYAVMHRKIRQFYSQKFNSIFRRRKRYI
ncbi:histamine H3 receptor-like [Asterias rubens]|uniref:histamine H3 receptor-like n=1 Tax=Asterias rubens TaxID=7604 RepID=UPI00145574E8|nr:histamine H3 receptor-like [Asterias rubens]